MASERDALVPVFAENVKLPLEFRRRHTIDLTAWTGDATAPEFAQVRRAVAAHSQRIPLATLSQEPIIETAATPSSIITPGIPSAPPIAATQETPAAKYSLLMAVIVALLVAPFLYFKGASAVVIGVALILAAMVTMIAHRKKKRIIFILYIGSVVISCSLVLFMRRNPAATESPFPNATLSYQVAVKKTKADLAPKHAPAIPQQSPSSLATEAPSPTAPSNSAGPSIAANKDDQVKALNSSTDLILNGSFEELVKHDVPSNWATESWAKGGELRLDSGEHRSGTHSVKLSAGSPNHLRWVQEIVLHPRSSYLLSGWVKTEGVEHTSELDDKGASLAVRWESPTGLRFFVSKGVFGTSGEWQPLRFYFETEDASIVTIILQLGSYSGTTSGAAWFDDIHLEAVSPE